METFILYMTIPICYTLCIKYNTYDLCSEVNLKLIIMNLGFSNH